MNRPRSGNRYRAGGLLLALVGLLAAVGALAGFAVAKDGSHRTEKRHHHGHHRRHDGGAAAAGTIASFDTETGRLAIALPEGEKVSGLVTDRTRIRCEDESSPDVTQLRRGEKESGDDRGGQGEEEPGDDRGGQDEESGDDQGGDNSGPGSSQSGGGPSGNDDNGAGANCTASDLIVGATVQRAELEIANGSATFDEVELAT